MMNGMIKTIAVMASTLLPVSMHGSWPGNGPYTHITLQGRRGKREGGLDGVGGGGGTSQCSIYLAIPFQMNR